jgi:uncharacterized protein
MHPSGGRDPVSRSILVRLPDEIEAEWVEGNHDATAVVRWLAMKSIPRTMRGMMVLMALANLDDADAFLRNFAARHGTRHLALFGSVLRGEDTPASDVDLLMEFEKGRTPGLLGTAEMELELGAVLGREVEVRTYEDLSRYFRDDVRAQARVLYAA